MMLQGNVIRALLLSVMVGALAYVSAEETSISDCSDYDFAVCMEGWECPEDPAQDCYDMLAVVGDPPCTVEVGTCGSHWRCIGQQPRQVCEFANEVVE